MKLTQGWTEGRRQRRTRGADAITWRIAGRSDGPQAGWLLESSEDGMAFAWRGDGAPEKGSLIDLLRQGPSGASEIWQRAVVRHLAKVHDDLCIFGVELLRFRDFPPSPARMPRPHKPPLDTTVGVKLRIVPKEFRRASRPAPAQAPAARQWTAREGTAAVTVAKAAVAL